MNEIDFSALRKVMPERVVLHVGMTKTGSTAIQNTFEKNHDFLLEKGVLFPRSVFAHTNSYKPYDTPGHFRILKYAKTGDLGQFEAELVATQEKANTLFLSAENFFLDIDENGYQILRQLFSGKTVEILCFVRPQVEWAISRYYQSVTNGHKKESRPFNEFVEHLISEGQLNYHNRLNYLMNMTGASQVNVIDYERVKKNGSSVAATLTALGLEDKLPNSITEKESNISVPYPEAVEAQRRLNTLHASMLKDEFLAWSKQFSGAASTYCQAHGLSSSHLKASRALRQQILESCRESNLRLSEEFLGGVPFGPDERVLQQPEPEPLDETIVGELLKQGIELLAPSLKASKDRDRKREREHAKLLKKRDSLRENIQRHKRDQAKLLKERDTLKENIQRRERGQAKLLKERDSLKENIRHHKREQAKLRKERDALFAHSWDLEKRYRAVLSSSTWRAMGPVRVIMRCLRQLLTGRHSAPNHIPKRPRLSDDPAKQMALESNGDTVGTTPSSPRKKLRPQLRAVTTSMFRRAYGCLPEIIRARVPRDTKGYVKSWSVTEGRAAPLAKQYDDKLWGGFSRSGLIDLLAIKSNEDLSIPDRTEACYSLARWHAVQGDFTAGLREMTDRRNINPKLSGKPKQFMVEAFFLCRLGREEEARALVEQHSKGRSFNPSVELMLANTWNPEVGGAHTAEAEAKVLEHLNAVYRHFGLPEIDKRDPDVPLSIDNLRGRDVKPHFDPDNKISVIVPAYNAADTIVTALTSLAEQSWQNLEVLVVDDCSTDDTAAVVETFCAGDTRFRLLRQEVNGGSYACRNRALDEVTGKYVTIHDSDDWAHPHRLACQMAELQTVDRPYNLSQWVRATTGLRFRGPWRVSATLFALNMGSLLFEKEVIARVGKWNPVRISADSEFIRRLEVVYGVSRKDCTISPCPLVLGRDEDTSLTQAKATHVSTFYHGLRRTYLEVSESWHRSLQSNGEKNRAHPRAMTDLPFPHSIRSNKPRATKLDLLLIGNFNMIDSAFQSAMNMLHTAHAAGLQAGIFHYPAYHRDTRQPLNSDVIEFAHGERARIVAAGEKLSSAKVVIFHATPFSHYMDRFPQIDADRVIVAKDQMPARNGEQEDPAHDPIAISKHLVDYFGTEGDQALLSEVVREIVKSSEQVALSET